MNYKIFSKPKAMRKTLSVLAITGLVLGSLSGLVYSRTAEANNGINTYTNPSTGTLSVGDNLEVHMTVTLDPNDTNPITLTACTVNAVDVKNSFQNFSSGTSGHFMVTYTVGSGDANRSAGTIPINCTLHQTGSVTVTGFDDNNTVAINTTIGGGGGTTTPSLSLSEVSISPNTGTSTTGSAIEVFFREASGTSDLTVTGTCKVNAMDVGSTFQNLGSGLYKVSYTVGSSDGERPAGHVPIGCTLGNSSGNITASAWTDNNTLIIDTNGDGMVDNGTNTLGFTVVASPNSGALMPGDSIYIYLQDPLPSADVVIGSAGCRVNNVDVSGSYIYQGNGLYRLTYTVGQNDTSRYAGEIPFDCTLQNQTGSVHLVSFTDNNTLSIECNGTGGGTGTTTTSTSTNPITFTVAAVPGSGTLHASSTIDVYLQETHGNLNIGLNGTCRVNDVNVAGSFVNLTDGLYKVMYTVGANDPERAAGTIPINCALKDTISGTSTVVTGFTDNNTLAIDTNNNGAITPPTGTSTPYISTVIANPSSGTLSVGQQLTVQIQEGNSDAGFTGGSCTINAKDVSSTWVNMGNGLYKVIYTVAAGDTNVSAGQLAINCNLSKTGSTLHIGAFTDNNTVAINTSTGGGTGTTTTATSTTGGNIHGSVGGSATSSTTTLAVTSIDQIETVALSGGGYDTGWVWIFNVTVPSNETILQTKFANWVSSNGSTTIPVAGNMRVSSPQSSTSTPVTITSANTYSSPINLSSDLDTSAPGRQIQLLVEMQVPAGTPNGSYTTSYGIRSSD
jgi:hypothetical protein